MKLRCFITFTLLVAVIVARAQIVNPIQAHTVVPNYMEVCQGQGNFTMEITNGTNDTLLNIRFNITLPEGITYVQGSLSSTTNTVVQEADEININNPGIVIAYLLPNTMAKVYYSCQAGCSINPYQNGESNDSLHLNNISLGTYTRKGIDYPLSDDFSTSTYSVVYPYLTITMPEAQQSINSSYDEKHTRQIKVTNNGLGRASAFKLKIKYDSGLKLKSVKYQEGSTTDIPYTSSSGYNYLTINDFSLAGDGDNLFEPGETITLYEDVLVQTCNASYLGTQYDTQWGCGDEWCNMPEGQTELNAFINVTNGTPSRDYKFEIIKAATYCENDYGIAQFTLTNNATEAKMANRARDNAIEIEVIPNATIQTISLYNYSTKSFVDIRDLGLSYNLGSTYCNLYFNAVTFAQDPDGNGGLSDEDGDGKYDVLKVNESIMFQVKYKLIEPTAVLAAQGQNSELSNEFIRVLWYLSDCCRVGIWRPDKIMHDLDKITMASYSPQDIFTGEDYNIEIKFAHEFPTYVYRDLSNIKYRFRLVLPQGLALVPVDTVLGGLNYHFTQTGNEVNWESTKNNFDYVLKFKYRCNDQSKTKLDTIWQHYYYRLTDCQETHFYSAKPVFTHTTCSSDNTAQLKTNVFKFTRTTFGYTSPSKGYYTYKELRNTNRLNENTPGINLNYGRFNDTVLVKIDGKLLNDNLSADSIFARVSFDESQQKPAFSGLDGNFIINGTTYHITNIRNGYVNEYGKTRYAIDFFLSLPGNQLNSIPASTDISFIGNVIVSRQISTCSYFDIVNLRGGLQVSSPTVETATETLGNSFRLIEFYLTAYHDQYYTGSHSNLCNLIYKLSLFDGNIVSFPNEYRQAYFPKKIVIYKPKELIYVKNSANFTGSNIYPQPIVYDDSLVFIGDENWPVNPYYFQARFTGSKTMDYWGVTTDVIYDNLNPNTLKIPKVENTDLYVTGYWRWSNIFRPKLYLSSEDCQIGYNKTVTWPFILGNKYTEFTWPSSNTWLAFKPLNDGVKIKSLTTADGENIQLIQDGDIYFAQIGTLPKLEGVDFVKKMKITASYAECQNDAFGKIAVYTGWDCDGYPIPSNYYKYYLATDTLMLQYKTADINSIFHESESSHNLCDEIQFEQYLAAISEGTLYDLKFRMKFPEYCSLIDGNLNTFVYPVDADPRVLGTPVYNTSDSTFEWDLSTIIPELETNDGGLVGNRYPSSNKISFDFSLMTECGFDAGKPLRFWLEATSNCGDKFVFNEQKRVRINGLPPLDTMNVALTGPASIYPQGDTRTISVNITNQSGLDPTGPSSYLQVDLPRSLTFVDFVDYEPIRHRAASQDSVEQLEWKLIDQFVAPGQTKSIRFRVQGTGLGVCSPAKLYSRTIVKGNALCQESSQICQLIATTGDYTGQVAIMPPALNAYSYNASCSDGHTYGGLYATITGGSSQAQVRWEKYNGKSWDLVDIVDKDEILTNVAIGEYRAILVDPIVGEACTAITSRVEVTYPQTSLEIKGTSACKNNVASVQFTTTVHLNTGSEPVSSCLYTIKDNLGNTVAQGPSGMAYQYELPVGKYTLEVQVLPYGCTTEKDFEVVQLKAIIVNARALNNVNCFGGNDGSAIVSATGADPFTYTWFNTSGDTISTAQSANELIAGGYYVDVLDGNGCHERSADVAITEPELLEVQEVLYNPDSCRNTATVTGGTRGYTYRWYKVTNSFTVFHHEIETIELRKTITGDSAVEKLGMGNFILKVQDSHGCKAEKDFENPEGDFEKTYTYAFKFSREEPKIDSTPAATVSDAGIVASLGGKVDSCMDVNKALGTAYLKTYCNTPDSVKDVLEINYTENLYHHTLYYYDRAGNLVRTVPPAGVDLTGTSREDMPAHTRDTRYQYNSLGQLVWQSTPDGGESRFYYDKLGRLRFSQNAKQAIDGTYSYSKYDAQNRIVETGQGSQAGFEGMADEATFPTDPSMTQWEVLTTYSEPVGTANYFGRKQRFVHNRVSYTVSINGTDSIYTYYSYDPHGNVEWVVTDIPHFSRSYLAYEYELISGDVTLVKYNEGLTDQFYHRYQYDKDNRITEARTSRDGQVWDSDARYKYYPTGPLARVELGEYNVQAMDYTYTVNGWLKSVNSPKLSPGKDPGSYYGNNGSFGQDAFGMMLQYNPYDMGRSDHLLAGIEPQMAPGEGLYNGNIRSWTTNHQDNGGLAAFNYSGMTNRKFTYDQLNRISTSQFNTYDTQNDQWGAAANNNYGSQYDYDPNGNLRALKRFGYMKDQGSNALMDDLAYVYEADKNRLHSVTDNSTSALDGTCEDISGTHNYTYDAIGNLVADPAEEIANIEWTPYGKVYKITRAAGSTKPDMEFSYDATGNRVAKKLHWANGASPDEATYYVRDASGNIMATYNRELKQQADGTTMAELHVDQWYLYGSDRLGAMDAQGLLVGRMAVNQYAPFDPTTWVPEDELLHTSTPMDLLVAKAQQDGTLDVDGQLIDYMGLYTVPVNPVVASVQEYVGQLVGKPTRCVAQYSDPYGNVLVNVAGVADASNNVVVNCMDNTGKYFELVQSQAIKASSQCQPALVSVPGSKQQFYLFTTGDDGKMYWHLLDLKATAATDGTGATVYTPGVVSANNQLMAEGAGYSFTTYTDKRANGKTLLYALENLSGQVNVVPFEITATGVARLANVLATAAGQSTMCSELRMAPDGGQLAFIKAEGQEGWFDAYSGTLVVATLASDHVSPATNVNTYPLNGLVTANTSLEYSADGQYLYYNLTSLDNDARKEGLYRAQLTGQVAGQTLTAIRVSSNQGITRRLYNGNLLHINQSRMDFIGEDVDGGISGVPQGLTASVSVIGNTDYTEDDGDNTYTRLLGLKQYELKDHLGNVRAVVTDRKLPGDTDGTYKADLLTAQEYYPFGMVMPGRQFNFSKYRFGFQGQEKDDEITGHAGSHLAFEYRIQDTRIGRFLSVDPMVKSFPWNSSYAFDENRVIDSKELEGLESVQSTHMVTLWGEYSKGKIDKKTMDQIEESWAIQSIGGIMNLGIAADIYFNKGQGTIRGAKDAGTQLLVNYAFTGNWEEALSQIDWANSYIKGIFGSKTLKGIPTMKLWEETLKTTFDLKIKSGFENKLDKASNFDQFSSELVWRLIFTCLPKGKSVDEDDEFLKGLISFTEDAVKTMVRKGLQSPTEELIKRGRESFGLNLNENSTWEDLFNQTINKIGKGDKSDYKPTRRDKQMQKIYGNDVY